MKVNFFLMLRYWSGETGPDLGLLIVLQGNNFNPSASGFALVAFSLDGNVFKGGFKLEHKKEMSKFSLKYIAYKFDL